MFPRRTVLTQWAHVSRDRGLGSTRTMLAIFALGLLLVPLVSGCGANDVSGSGKTKRLILLTNGADPFWDAMLAGMQDAQRDLKLDEAGLQVVRENNDATPKGQIDRLRQFANQSDIAAIAVSVTDANNPAIARAMEECQTAGIKVITIDSDINRETDRKARFAYLGTDNFLAGQELGKAAAGLQPDGGKYATFVGLKGAFNAIGRISGFASGVNDKFTQVENLGDNMDRSVAKKNVKDALDRHPDLNTLVGIWGYNAHAIVEVVKERRLRDQVKVVVFDASPDALVDLTEGHIDAMIVQNPYQMGYLGTRLMKAILDEDHQTIHELYPDYDPQTQEFTTTDGDIHTTGLRIVYPDGATGLSKDLFSEGTEFLSLSDFKAWLTQYKLVGS